MMATSVLAGLSACSEHEEADPQYANWNVRNHDYFVSTMQKAKDSITATHATWGDAWTDHCGWRAMPQLQWATPWWAALPTPSAWR